MTTKKELVEWLAQFDDDMEIEVVTVKHYSGSWHEEYYINETELILPNVRPAEISWGNSYFHCLEFQDLDMDYEGDDLLCKRVGKLILGRSDL